MLEVRKAVAVAATASLDAGTGLLCGVTLTGGSDAASAVLKVGGSGGTVILTLKAPANTTVMFTPPCGIGYRDLHVTLTGTGPAFTAIL